MDDLSIYPTMHMLVTCRTCGHMQITTGRMGRTQCTNRWTCEFDIAGSFCARCESTNLTLNPCPSEEATNLLKAAKALCRAMDESGTVTERGQSYKRLCGATVKAEEAWDAILSRSKIDRG